MLLLPALEDALLLLLLLPVQKVQPQLAAPVLAAAAVSPLLLWRLQVLLQTLVTVVAACSSS